MPGGDVVTPDIRDAERLQGFDADWTRPAEEVVKPGFRWQAVGNAVSVDVVEWLAGRLVAQPSFDDAGDAPPAKNRWPYAAWADLDGIVRASRAGTSPVWRPRPALVDFLEYPTKPLSVRAAAGFLKRTRKGNLRFQPGFLEAVQAHMDRQLAPETIAA
jgi:DNA (cytosine-5)-methyltransferase 1